jgi:HPt (histidine-containing phosphotransfer) domain-containing protein
MEQDDVIREFLAESHENLSRLDQELVDLEKRPKDAALLAAIFRTIHTIKGTCGFLGFSKLETITHQAENLLSQLRDGRNACDHGIELPEARARAGKPAQGRLTLRAVLVECDRDEACRLAGRFLSIDPPDAVNDMVRDVMGEIANMIGGNLKCVLTPGITLSTPFVIDGSNSALPVCGAGIREPLTFACAEGAFWVTVLKTSLK